MAGPDPFDPQGSGRNETSGSSPDGGAEQASAGDRQALRQWIFVAGLLVLALILSYLIVFRIDPAAADLHHPAHGAWFAMAPQGDVP